MSIANEKCEAFRVCLYAQKRHTIPFGESYTFLCIHNSIQLSIFQIMKTVSVRGLLPSCRLPAELLLLYTNVLHTASIFYTILLTVIILRYVAEVILIPVRSVLACTICPFPM